MKAFADSVDRQQILAQSNSLKNLTLGPQEGAMGTSGRSHGQVREGDQEEDAAEEQDTKSQEQEEEEEEEELEQGESENNRESDAVVDSDAAISDEDSPTQLASSLKHVSLCC